VAKAGLRKGAAFVYCCGRGGLLNEDELGGEKIFELFVFAGDADLAGAANGFWPRKPNVFCELDPLNDAMEYHLVSVSSQQRLYGLFDVQNVPRPTWLKGLVGSTGTGPFGCQSMCPSWVRRLSFIVVADLRLSTATCSP
jgi:hypothetical protein